MADQLNAQILGDSLPFDPKGYVGRVTNLLNTITDECDKQPDSACLCMVAGPDAMQQEMNAGVVWNGDKEDISRMIAAAMDADPEFAELISAALLLNYTEGK